MINCNCQKWHQDGCSEGRDADEMGNPIELVDCMYFLPSRCPIYPYTGAGVELAYCHSGSRENPKSISERQAALWQQHRVLWEGGRAGVKCPGNELVDCQHYEPFDDAQDKPLICAHCGHTGQEVGLAWQHVGGYCDHRLIPQCINRLACWQRWERNQLAQIRK